MSREKLSLIGEIAVAAAGGVIGLWGISHLDPWLPQVGLGIVLALGIVLWFWFSPLRRNGGEAAKNDQTTFIRGNVSGSTLSDIDSQADQFVDGSVKNSGLRKIVHRPRRSDD